MAVKRMRLARRAGILVLVLAAGACAGGANPRPGRLAQAGVELLAPTTITLSNFPLHQVLVVQLVRGLYADEGVSFPERPTGDTLLLSAPVTRGNYEVTYRVRLHLGEKTHLVSLDALYRASADSVSYIVTHDARGELGRVWNGQLRMARKLLERRFGKCCVYDHSDGAAAARGHPGQLGRNPSEVVGCDAAT
jgi:hypothetical protein